jgi:hypothetical protein
MSEGKGKGIAALLVSKMGPRGPEGEAESNGDEGLDAAAEDILAAVESKDASALKSALKAFYEQC